MGNLHDDMKFVLTQIQKNDVLHLLRDPKYHGVFRELRDKRLATRLVLSDNAGWTGQPIITEEGIKFLGV